MVLRSVSCSLYQYWSEVFQLAYASDLLKFQVIGDKSKSIVW